VVIDATSDPDSGSVSANAAIASPRATRGSQAAFCAGVPVERLYREIRALRIYEGTTEIQKLVIAGQVMAAHGEAQKKAAE
jgi:alkylation response protein AidB-like acyl-CoA dehydrogenase